MGFAGIGAAAILLIGVMYAGASVASGNAAASASMDAARLEWSNHQRQAQAAALHIESVAWQDGETSVVVENAGEVPLDAAKIHVLIDNGWHEVLAHDVDGKATDVWHVGGRLTVHVASAPPSSIVVVAQYGNAASWRS